MANKYANLVGTNKIKDEYTKINTGFDGVEVDINKLKTDVTAVNTRVDTIITTPISGEAATQEIVDARVSAVKSKTFATLDARFEETEQDIATHMADMAAHGVSHKNILHNWDFRNPVNQRGLTSTTNAGYTIDRWRLVSSGHTVEVVSDGIKLIASKNAGLDVCFAQLVENYSRFVGVPLTLSAHIVENTLTQGCRLRWNERSGPVITGTGYFSHTFTPSSLSSLQIGVQFNNRSVDDGKYVIIDKMKLEIGSTSTLANDPPADYGEQLALCQRYYQKINILRPLCSCHPTRLELMVPLSVPLRSVPTIESYSVPAWFRVDGNQYVGSDYIAASNAAFVLDSNYNIFTSAITITFSLSPEISAITNKLGYASNFTAALSADL